MSKEHRIDFPQYGREIYALTGTSIFECVTRAGILIRTPCAGSGTCGKCRIKVIAGQLKPSIECEKLLSDQEITAGLRLACRTFVESDLSIEIPADSLFEHDLLVETGETGVPECSGNPMVVKTCLSLSESSLEDPVADLANISQVLGQDKLIADLPLMQQLPEILREKDFTVTAVCSENRLLVLEAGDTAVKNFAVGVDIGTTTLVVSLLDAATARTVGTRGMLNPQVQFGDDVISRICAQGESPEQCRQMQQLVVDAINGMLAELTSEAGIDPKQIYAVTVAGNTVMECLFCGIPTGPMGEIPFAPPFQRALQFKAADLGLKVNPGADLLVFPVIGGFVGGDIVAGLLVTELADTRASTLFVDVGTNGEIVLVADGQLYATAAAAGPAFEGARIEAGMRAAPGAIE